MLEIEYESQDFPRSGPVANGFERLPVTWDDLLWAAVTVGRPSRFYAFRHGTSSLYEALFRISALRMAVEQAGPNARRLRRTATAKSLDPSEKGAVNYFLGLTLCKLFAEQCLRAPWLLHLDVFRNRLNLGWLLNGRSRPDLVGRTLGGDWIAMEAKGRVSPPSSTCKDKAKKQAERIYSINGRLVQYRIGGFAYFKDDVLRFYWCDPPPDELEPENAIKLALTEDDIWKAYYQPILELTGTTQSSATVARGPLSIEQADLKVKVVDEVMGLLRFEKWKEAGLWCLEHREALAREGIHNDGVQIVAGDSWSKRFFAEAE